VRGWRGSANGELQVMETADVDEDDDGNPRIILEAYVGQEGGGL